MALRRIIDLSYPINNAMPVYPGDPVVHTRLVHNINDGGYNVSEICMGSHTGTHVDSQHHVMHTDHAVDSLPLDSMVGWAEVLDLTDISEKSEITSADLDKFADRVKPGARLLLKTDWGKKFGKAEFFTDFPCISEGAAGWLVARSIKLLGIEQPSLHTTHDIEVHKALLSNNIVLIESIANMDQIHSERVYLAALPLKLAGLDGAPVRAIAIEGIELPEGTEG